jgi:hypothetical protein
MAERLAWSREHRKSDEKPPQWLVDEIEHMQPAGVEISTSVITARGGVHFPIHQGNHRDEPLPIWSSNRPLREGLPTFRYGRNGIRFNATPKNRAVFEVRRGFAQIQRSLCLCKFTHEGCCEHPPERLTGDCPVHGPHLGWDDD